MARNRKYSSGAWGLAGLVRWVAFLVLTTVLVGGGYVWQKNQIFELGQEIKKRELQLGELRYQNEKLRQQLATLQSPAMLETRVRELNLGLAPVTAQQEVFTLAEPEVAPLIIEQERQYAAQRVAAAELR
ncbi:MAG: septum formation initiator family protein [Verrucomicrobiae bacterium]|nr:septum formation initiator family protein [Verrucomicrobiae bacterium]MCX7722736.1 septum formation initiator family protein [Verrucomicrobiae bacterium]MDW7981137.1 septum formation initiator family protein [Verrucomicrobiales bacterium]